MTDREGKGMGKKGIMVSNENDEKRAAHIFIYIYIRTRGNEGFLGHFGFRSI